MLPLKKPSCRRHPLRHAFLVGRLSFVALLFLLTSACWKLQADEFCFFTDDLQFELLELPSDGRNDSISFSLQFSIGIAQIASDALEWASPRNPELLPHSIRIVNPHNTSHLFTRVNMEVHPPKDSNLLAKTIVDERAPSSGWPSKEINIKANPVNIIDYVSDRSIEVKTTLQTKISLQTLFVGIEVCAIAKISGPLPP